MGGKGRSARITQYAVETAFCFDEVQETQFRVTNGGGNEGVVISVLREFGKLACVD